MGLTTVEKMKPEIRQLWLQALRSDEYKQGQTYLKADFQDFPPAYCCLGVLTQLYINANEGTSVHWEASMYSTPEEIDTAYVVCDSLAKVFNSTSLLPIVEEWAGFEHSLDYDEASKTIQKLIGMNDGGQSFDQIADWIEENL